MLMRTWFCMFWWMYLSLKSFLNMIVKFSWNQVCSVSHQKWRSDLSSVFLTSLKRSVYHMTAASHKHKERFDFMIFSFLIVMMFLIHWIKTKTFWIQSLLLMMIISFSMSSSGLKNSISSDLNCLLNLLLTLMTVKAAVAEVSVRFAVLMTVIMIAVIFSIIWIFFSSAVRLEFPQLMLSLMLLIMKKLDELTWILTCWRLRADRSVELYFCSSLKEFWSLSWID